MACAPFWPDDLLQGRLGRAWPPCPGVAKPEGRQYINFGRLRPAVTHADLDEEVFWRLLGIFHEDVEVAVFVEDSCVQEFVLHVVTGAPLVRLDQIAVGIFRLRILVQVLHVRVRRRAVEIEVIFFDVFAVVGLAVRQPEHTFFEDGVFAVPQSHAEAQPLIVVADAGKAILTPVIGAGPGLVVSEVVPGITILAVVLANRTPLPFAKIRTPLPPGYFVVTGFL